MQSRQHKQEAQLSQRDRAMLRFTEYFAESLKVTKVIQNDTLEKEVSPVVCRCNHARSVSRTVSGIFRVD